MELTAKAPEKDTFAKFYFLLQGAGTLISWNAILNGIDYFTDNLTPSAADLLPFIVNGAQVVTNLFMPYLGRVVPLRYRIIIPLIGLSLLLVLLPIEVNFVSPESFRLALIIVMLFLLGVLNNVYQGSMSGYVGQFPFKYISFYLMGTGLAGVIMNILRAFAILALSNASEIIEIIVYFVAAGLILAACGVIHPVFTRSYFCRYYLGGLHSVLNASGQSDELMRSEAEQPNKKDFKAMIAVFKVVWPYVLILVITYIETFWTFPGVMLSKQGVTMSTDWEVVSMLAVFNVFDVVGKNIAQYRQYYNMTMLIFVLIGRVIFDIFFIFQAYRDWAVFDTLWFAYLNIALFGTTNGFMTTACFIMGPENVEGEKKEIAGFLSVFGLTTGITTGSLIAYLIYG